MPSIQYQQSTQRLNTGGSPGQIQPSALNAGAAAGLRSVQIRGRDVVYEPYPIPDIVEDVTSKSIQKLGATLTDAAVKFRDREDTAHANEVVLETDTAMKKLAVEFMSKNGKEATDAHSAYVAKLSSITDQQLNKLNPAARQKAALRIQSLHDTFAVEGAAHRVKQQQLREDVIAAKQEQQAYENIVLQAGNPIKLASLVANKEAAIMAQYADRPEYAALKSKEFRDTAYKGGIESMIQLEQFGTAEDLILAGYDAQADPSMLASYAGKNESAQRAYDRRLDVEADKTEDVLIDTYAKDIRVMVESADNLSPDGKTAGQLRSEIVAHSGLKRSGRELLLSFLDSAPRNVHDDPVLLRNIEALIPRAGALSGDTELLDSYLSMVQNPDTKLKLSLARVASRNANTAEVYQHANSDVLSAYLMMNGIDPAVYKANPDIQAQVDSRVLAETAGLQEYFIKAAYTPDPNTNKMVDVRRAYGARVLSVVKNMKPVALTIAPNKQAVIYNEFNTLETSIRSGAFSTIDDAYAALAKVAKSAVKASKDYEDHPAMLELYNSAQMLAQTKIEYLIKTHFKQLPTPEDVVNSLQLWEYR